MTRHASCPGCKTGWLDACDYCKAWRFLPNEIRMTHETWEWLVKNLPDGWVEGKMERRDDEA